MGFESLSFFAAIAAVGLSLIIAVIAFFSGRSRSATGQRVAGRKIWMRLETAFIGLGLLLLTLAIISRAVATGHGPFSNMYEFAIAFAWGTLVMSLVFLWHYHAPAVKRVGAAVALVLLVFASSLPSKPVPLVPALQQSFLLSAHVAAAMIAYGAFAMGFGAAILYFVRSRANPGGVAVLDEISYMSVKIGFPFMTLLIILGALWADIAWGSYWSWDPKETASLVTWLLFAGYLHARVVRGWQGRRAALLLIVGFAAVLFTFFGNYIFSGLHAYQ